MAVWLLLWQLGAMALNQKILLVSPVQVLLRLGELLPQGSFWGAVGFSFWRITLGFLLACAAGTALGVLSSRFWPVRDLCAPADGHGEVHPRGVLYHPGAHLGAPPGTCPSSSPF